jgi:hypothetical protein
MTHWISAMATNEKAIVWCTNYSSDEISDSDREAMHAAIEVLVGAADVGPREQLFDMLGERPWVEIGR